MNRTQTLHPVYRSMNKPLTIWGAERRLFLLALVIGAAMFNFFGSLLGGLVMFVALFMGARWITATDAQLLRIVLNSARFRTRYDPAKLAYCRRGARR
jgi:type IV secretory pathway TrbD component